jgi:hypothetical protein
LKEKLEQLPIKRSNCTIISFNVVCMCPSVIFNQIESAVNYFLQDAPQSEKDLAVGGEMVQWPKYFYPLILMKIGGWIEYD